ncbi:MAG: hypothetical protein ABIK18_02980 [candidate division WOR-3 bacterium]
MSITRYRPYIIFCPLAFLVACAPKVTKPASQTVTVFVSGDLPFLELPQLAQVVSERKENFPVLWLMSGEVFADDVTLALGDGETEAKALYRAGVDAVLFTPDWLKLGLSRAKGLIDQTHFRVLSANINDTFDLPIAHPWMRKLLTGVNFGITGLFLDSNDLFLKLNCVHFVPPDYAGKRTLTLLKSKADISFLLLPPGESIFVPGFDLILRPEEKGTTRYDITLIEGRVQDVVKRQISLAGIEPKPEVLKVIDSLKNVLDSLSSIPVVDSRVKIPPSVLTKRVIEGILKENVADLFLYDSTDFIPETLLPGTITRGQIITAFSDPGKLVIFDLDGEEIKRLRNRAGVKVLVRSGLPSGRLPEQRVYSVATTGRFLKKHPEIPVNRLELSEKRLWEYAVDILQAQGKR